MKLTAGSFENLGFFIERLRAPDLAWLRGVGGSIGFSVMARAIGFVNAVLLARLLQPAGFGLYSYAYSIAALLAVPAQFGIPTIVTREVSTGESLGRWDLARGVIWWAHAGIAFFSVIVLTGAGGVLAFAAPRLTPAELATYAVAMTLVPLLALDAVRAAVLTGLHRVVLGRLSADFLRPFLMLIVLLVAFLVDPPLLAMPIRAVGLLAAAAALSYGLGTWILLRVQPGELRRTVSAYAVCRWSLSAFPIGLGSGLQLVNQYASILILGVFASKVEVGHYRIATLGASLMVMGLIAVDTAFTPYFARFAAQADRRSLQRFAIRSARLALSFAMPLAIIYALFGKQIIALLFGHSYARAYTPLAILAGCQLVNAATGSVSSLLNMSHCERDVMVGVGISAAVTVILNLVLVPRFGMNGAAAATGAGIIAWNLVLWCYVWERLGVVSGPWLAASKDTAL